VIKLLDHLIFIPRISKQEEHCRLIEWRKEEGEFLTAGETILIYETQKASSDFEAPVSGILKQIIISSGEWLDVTKPVGIIAINNKKK